MLSKPAEEINLADVIEAIDGPVTPGGCLRESVEPNSGTSIAVIQDVWLDVRDCVMDVLSTMDLAHLREKLLRKNGATLAAVTAEVLSTRPLRNRPVSSRA